METALGAYAALLMTLVWLVSRRYGVVNPIAYFAAFYSLQTLVAPLALAALGLANDASEAAKLQTVGYSALYFGAIALPFLLRFSPLLRPLILARNSLLPRDPPAGATAYGMLTAEFVLLFALLIAASGSIDWLTSPRTAYQLHRAGVGLWWAFCQGALLTGLAAFFTRRKRHAVETIAACLAISTCAYFLGSKSYMLFPLVLAVFYYEHTVARIPRWMLLATVATALLGIAVLQIIQGTATSAVDTVGYFDYFGNSAQFLDEFAGRFHHTWGETWLSSFWQYVPRALDPDKPYAYGIARIMEDFQPGAAENGSTAGILPWAAAYLDFGWAGIAAEGLMLGFLGKAVFELMCARPSVASILIFAQLGIQTAQPVYSAPLPLFWLWLAAQMLLLKVAGGMRHEAFRYFRARGLTRAHIPTYSNVN